MIVKIVMMLLAVAVNSVMGATLAQCVGVDGATGAVVMNGLAIVASQADLLPAGLREGVLTEVWTGELVKQLRAGLTASWLDGISDQSSLVNNDVIHMVEVGIDPDVLVNNTTYPIETQALYDRDIAIQLNKFQTKATPVTDDELYALSYDKMARVREAHANAINDKKFAMAAHAIAPQRHAVKTPVLATTGEATDGRKRLTRADILSLKAAFDKLRVPTEGRRLVLCTDHVNDLLSLDQKFADQYYNYTTGKIANLFGFQVYEFANCPTFTTAGQKEALGGAGNQASFAFYVPRIFKATGSTKMYYSEAATDPLNQRNLINFRHYFLCMPKLQEAVAAIYSAAGA